MTGACIVGAGCCDCKKSRRTHSASSGGSNCSIPGNDKPDDAVPTAYEHKEHTEDSKTSEPKIVIQ